MAEWSESWGEDWGGAVATIENHEEEAVDRLPQAFVDKTTPTKHTEIFAARWQRIENVLADILTLYDIQRGAGFALDSIGENIGIDRLGFDNDFYRVLLATQSGIVIPRRRTVEGVLTMVRALLNDDTRAIIYKESPIKTFTIEVADITAEELEFFPRFLRLTKPATYRAQFIASKTSGFVYDDSTAAVTVTGEGFSDESLTIDVGGEYAFIIPI